MKITIVERKMQISDELRAYATKKVTKLDRYFHKDTSATITFSELKGRQTAEVTVRHSGMVFRAEETTTDMFASVDGMIRSIEKQIRRNKTRLEKKLREGAFDKAAANDASMADYVEDSYDVIRRKRFDVVPMTVEEAILQMNLLGHQFFFFKNAESDDAPAVIYKRAAGGYGLIESN
ncbi:MAG TPA: ribosome-associated translation inhibitor RaiA [Candidatus Butyricicoccus stercorigallinarum]|nr:ribosome-associated translation inhibitor RaiA [Candidatus Butyricicoccus stercorigallinarum]